MEEIDKNMIITNTKYDLILQNNGSKEFFIYSGLTDTSTNHLYYRFDLELEVPDGEYTFVVQANNRNDVNYELRIPVLTSILHTGDGDVMLGDLQPDTGLLIIGDKVGVQENTYDDSETNNLIFYYDN